jgi:hypothetical protein
MLHARDATEEATTQHSRHDRRTARAQQISCEPLESQDTTLQFMRA